MCIIYGNVCTGVDKQASEAAPKTPAVKNVVSTADTAETMMGEELTEDNAPTPKHWSSDWDPTLNSLLSTYVRYAASLYTNIISRA